MPIEWNAKLPKLVRPPASLNRFEVLSGWLWRINTLSCLSVAGNPLHYLANNYTDGDIKIISTAIDTGTML